jgi:NAD(P)-dependent dehydrogenase (short-subunit alcohol dehydrogenase family)
MSPTVRRPLGAVKHAHEHFGGLDIVVNNAGYGHFGMVEEISEQDARAQIETNLFGALWVTQAALPFLREQGSGHIIQVSSIGGISAFPSVGIYHASKWGLEGISQALAQEVKGFGINVTLVEPGGFSTDWSGPSAKRSEPNAAYDGLRERQQQWRASNVPGDPAASGVLRHGTTWDRRKGLRTPSGDLARVAAGRRASSRGRRVVVPKDLAASMFSGWRSHTGSRNARSRG